MIKSLNTLSAWFYQKTTSVLVLIFLGLQMLMVAVVLPKLEQAIAAYSPLKILDLRFGFSPDEAYALMEGLGAQGRALYGRIELTADMAYPLIYTGLFVWLISLLYRNVLPPTAHLRRINLLPFAVLLFDYLENIGIVLLLRQFPARADTLARWVSWANQAKWLVFAMVVAIALAGLAIAVVRYLRRRGAGA